MIVVSDTTPLRYLIEIGHVDVLPSLFESVCTTPKVIEELRHPVAPEIVRDWATALPKWLVIRSPARLVDFGRRLDDGEAEALSLAAELRPARLLTDDRAGWQEAERLGLRPLRTVPVLWLASELKLLDLDQALDRLEQTTFRITKAILHRYRLRDAALRQQLRGEMDDVGKQGIRGASFSPRASERRGE